MGDGGSRCGNRRQSTSTVVDIYPGNKDVQPILDCRRWGTYLIPRTEENHFPHVLSCIVGRTVGMSPTLQQTISAQYYDILSTTTTTRMLLPILFTLVPKGSTPTITMTRSEG
jgi:hypothetical protein